MRDEATQRPRRITSEIDNELNAWLECANAMGSGQTIVVAAVRRMRAATSELERDSIRDEVRGYWRRLSLGIWALVFPGEPRPDESGPVTTKEEP